MNNEIRERYLKLALLNATDQQQQIPHWFANSFAHIGPLTPQSGLPQSTVTCPLTTPSGHRLFVGDGSARRTRQRNDLKVAKADFTTPAFEVRT
jgi:hypothetical protein